MREEGKEREGVLLSSIEELDVLDASRTVVSEGPELKASRTLSEPESASEELVQPSGVLQAPLEVVERREIAPTETVNFAGDGPFAPPQEAVRIVERFAKRLQREELVEDFRAYCALEGVEDADAFLSDLYHRDEIAKEAFLTAHAEAEIDLTGIVSRTIAKDSRYLSLGHIDEGGVGEIQVARDLDLRRRVAVKRLKDDKADLLQIRRFVKEAQITAQLDHPNVVPIYSIENRGRGEAGAIAFAMKLIHGMTLDSLVNECRTAQQQDESCEDNDDALHMRLEHFIKVCDAVAYAHSKGVIHRDLKPANIMVGKFGEVYVMDWGVARLMGERAALEREPMGSIAIPIAEIGVEETQAGQVVGTPFYMSPEQAKAKNDELRESSDIYSLGLILFELCTLQRAIPGSTWYDVVVAATRGETRAFAHLKATRMISPDLEAIFRRATSLEPLLRYQSAQVLADEVRRYLRGEEVLARPDNAYRRVLRLASRHRQITITLVMAVILLLSFATIWSLRAQKEAIEAAQTREAQVTGWQAEVASHSAEIDRRFLRIEGLLVRLASEAELLLSRPSSHETLGAYPHPSFSAGEGPPDYEESSLYGKAVSIDYPVFKLAQGVQLTEVEEKLWRLAPLRHAFQAVFLQSRTRRTPLEPAEVRQVMTVSGVPLRWAYLGLVEGVMYSYPGKAGYPSEYDPRQRPWYKMGAGSREARWGNPYIDLQGQGLILPAAVSLYAPDGTFLGVAGVELTFDEIITSFLQRSEGVGFLEASLLDAEGRVVVRSSQLASTFEGGVLHDALELKPYENAEVVEAIQEERSGFLELKEGGRFIAYHRIPTLGWYYIEEVDRGTLLGE